MRIRRRFSKTAGHAYLANECRACLALQGRHFQFMHEAELLGGGVPETTVVLDVPAGLEIPAEQGWYLRELAYSPYRRTELPQPEEERA